MYDFGLISHIGANLHLDKHFVKIFIIVYTLNLFFTVLTPGAFLPSFISSILLLYTSTLGTVVCATVDAKKE